METVEIVTVVTVSRSLATYLRLPGIGYPEMFAIFICPLPSRCIMK
jgi:hypothetical protein